MTHIQSTVATDPTGEWVILVDNLNIHVSESLVTLVATACERTEPLGKKTIRRAPKPNHTPRVLIVPQSSHPLRVPAQAQFLVEPN